MVAPAAARTLVVRVASPATGTPVIRTSLVLAEAGAEIVVAEAAGPRSDLSENWVK